MKLEVKNFLKQFSDSNKEKFNEEFIFMKKKDINGVLEYIDDICRALELIEGVDFLGSELVTDEFEIMNLVKFQEISISRLNLIKMRFRITGTNETEDKSEELEVAILFPKLVDEYYFIFNGSKYFPIYQLVDKDTYVIGYGESRSLALKTLLMPLFLYSDKKTVKFVSNYEKNDISFSGRSHSLKLFSKKINFLYYYFAKYGLAGTIKFFGLSKAITFVNTKLEDIDDEDDNEDLYYYSISSTLHIRIDIREINTEISLHKDFIISLASLFDIEKIRFSANSVEYWQKKLGGMFTKNINTQKEKSQKLLISFERILDSRTKTILNLGTNEKTIYGVVKWMIEEFPTLIEKDNIDLKNKRLRLSEYILYPLITKFSDNAYRIFNNRSKVSFRDLKSIFNIKINIVTKRIITSELLRYDNAVNGFDLFTSVLKVSQKGPQSIISTRAEVPMRYRNIHPSYIGNISLTHSSANEPGLNMCFTPFVESNGFFFDNIETNSNE